VGGGQGTLEEARLAAAEAIAYALEGEAAPRDDERTVPRRRRRLTYPASTSEQTASARWTSGGLIP
jgi:hypothetical protein